MAHIHHHEPHYHGWNAVPRDLTIFLKDVDDKNSESYTIEDINIPSTPAAIKAIEYAKQELPEPTFNHSMRVFYWGMSLLKNHRPCGLKENAPFVESFFLSCMLHDIGTIPKNIKATRLSFELWGAIKAKELLPSWGADEDQGDLVAEVINRHQDIGSTGTVPATLGLIYFGTLFGMAMSLQKRVIVANKHVDNIGANPTVVHKSTVEAVIKEFPRLNWSTCFASTIEEETCEKPWAHTTVIDKFAENVLENKLMQSYEEQI